MPTVGTQRSCAQVQIQKSMWFDDSDFFASEIEAQYHQDPVVIPGDDWAVYGGDAPCSVRAQDTFAQEKWADALNAAGVTGPTQDLWVDLRSGDTTVTATAGKVTRVVRIRTTRKYGQLKFQDFVKGAWKASHVVRYDVPYAAITAARENWLAALAEHELAALVAHAMCA